MVITVSSNTCRPIQGCMYAYIHLASYPEVDVNEVRRRRLSFWHSNTCGATSHVLGFETINGEFIACNLYHMICVVSSCHEKFSYSESCSTYSEHRDQTITEWSLIGR